MKLALAMAFQNEAPFLDLHLPEIMASGAIDGCVFLDGGSTDGSCDIIHKHCNNAVIYRRKFDWNFGAHFNVLIDCAEGKHSQEGDQVFDSVLRLDPDEVMFAQDIEYIKIKLSHGESLLKFPRYNFEGDRLHYMPQYAPDYQTRAWLLHRGIRYSDKKVHEEILGFPEAVDHVHIFHYEGLRPQNVRRYEKHHNYNLLAQGQNAIELPDDFDVPSGFASRPSELFKGDQPLDPRIIGIHSPFGD